MAMPEEHQNQPNIFVGGIDFDSDYHIVEQTDLLDCLAIRNGTGSVLNAVVNAGGNVLVENLALPSGINTVMGVCEDKRQGTLFYFVHNSNGDHTIFRYYPKKNLVNPNGEIELIAKGSALGFDIDHPVHSARYVDSKYLYWIDGYSEENLIEGNPPYKINAEKGNIVGKLLEYELLAGLPDQGQFLTSLLDGNQVNITVYDRTTNNLIAGIGILPATLDTFIDDPYTFLSHVVSQSNSFLSTYLEAEYCDECRASFIMKQDDTYLVIEETAAPFPNVNILFVRTNHYPEVLRQEHLDVIKWPPKCEPTVQYTIDSEYPSNNVNQAIFQFRTRFWFDDGEKSAWGPISILALPIDKSGTFLEGLNVIDIDFTNQRLNDPDSLCIIRKVEVAFRDGNLGSFRSADIIDICEIGINRNFYRFRNDKTYSVVASDDVVPNGQLQALKLFDSVPRISGAMEVMSDREGNNRLFYGANLENYDGPECMELSWEIATNPEDECFVDITGRVDIDYYGGHTADGYFRGPETDDTVIEGFVVYLAGTTYYGVSKSFEIPAVPSPTGVFEIKNVPRGIYVMRVANFKCRFDDTKGSIHNLNNGIAWQRTSAPVIDCAGSLAADSYPYERVLDLTAAGPTFDLLTEPGYGPIIISSFQIGEFNLPAFSNSGGIEFYFLDNEAGDGGDYAIRQGAIGVERQLLWFSAERNFPFSDIDFPYFLGPASDPLDPNYGSARGNCNLDHNGYCWVIWGRGANGFTGSKAFIYDMRVEIADVCGVGPTRFLELGGANAYSGGMSALWTNSEVNVNFDIMYGGGSGTDFADLINLYNVDAVFTVSNKTLIEGSTEESTGIPVPDVLMFYTRNGRQEFSDVTGGYSIAVYCPYDSFGRNDDTLYATYPTDNCYEYPPVPASQVPDISDFCGNPYDSTHPFTATTIVFPFVGAIVQVARYLKSGGVYRTAVVYEDRANRKCTAVEGDLLRVPFFTEIGEFKRFSVRWSINSVPPDWATHYRIVLTKDSFYRRYLPWIAEAVRYVILTSVGATPVNTSYANGDATHILIKISAIITDTASSGNPVEWFFFGTNLQGFSAQPKDRIRFILDETGAIVTTGEILDFEIVGVYRDGTDYYVVIETPEIFREVFADWLIELYTPQTNEEVVFYEMGECHAILDAELPGRRHEGSEQNQIIGVQPATGFLVGGDTYWRNKNYTVDSTVLLTYQVENPNITDRFDSIYTDIGRPNVADKDFGERFYFNRIRFSGIYIPDSKINGLSAFKSLDVQSLDMRYGNIIKLIAAAEVMLAICQFKTQPIYVSKDLLMDLSGNSSVGRSDKILNLANELKYNFGTMNPESVIEQDGNVYAWDVYQGIVWRYAPNGQFPISSYKANTFFSKLGKELYRLPRKDTRVYGFFEREYSLYGMTIAPNVAYPEGMTIEFSEDKNRWNNRMPFVGEYYGMSSDNLIAFKDGNLWLQEGVGHIHCNYFGTQYKAWIRFVSNQFPRAVKVWHNISLQGDNLWSSPNIEALPSYSYPQGMLSELPELYFTNEEGIWKADFLRDKTDPSNSFDNIVNPIQKELAKLYQGRVLRGEVLIIEIELVNSHLPSILRRVDVEHNMSMDTKA